MCLVQGAAFAGRATGGVPTGRHAPSSPLLAGERQSLHGVWLCRRGGSGHQSQPGTADYHRAAARTADNTPTTTKGNGRYAAPTTTVCQPPIPSRQTQSRHKLWPGLYLTGHRPGHCSDFYRLLWPVGHGRLYFSGDFGVELPAAVKEGRRTKVEKYAFSLLLSAADGVGDLVEARLPKSIEALVTLFSQQQRDAADNQGNGQKEEDKFLNGQDAAQVNAH
jgi:hypothetical protein